MRRVLKPGKFSMNPQLEENYLSEGQDGGRKLRILVAPLDWGLGHATRCVPIVYELLKQKCEVWLAAEGPQKALLTQEFPALPFLDLPGYRVKYGRSGPATIWRIIGQSGKMFSAIRQENNWLKKMVDEHQFDAVISDNRYGLYHKAIPSIFITHQLTIKSPLGKWSERLLQKKNYSYINRFTECWVPDDREDGLAGELSHPLKKPVIPLRYMGLLSRFKKNETKVDRPGKLLIVLSGPEPQRSILENKIVNEVVHYPGPAIVVRGLPAAANLIPSTNTIKFYNHLPADELNQEMISAEHIISRSGYSTVMDIMRLGKKSILIPTPGQTEQEYLADYLLQKQQAFCVTQDKFSLDICLQQAKSFPYRIKDWPSGQLAATITDFINSIR